MPLRHPPTHRYIDSQRILGDQANVVRWNAQVHLGHGCLFGAGSSCHRRDRQRVMLSEQLNGARCGDLCE